MAAVGSYLDARAHAGQWLVRIEDLDLPRTRPGAAGQILAELEAFGMEWDGPVLQQSSRFDLYAEAIERLNRSHCLRECACTRSALARLPENESRPAGTGEELFHPAKCLAVDAALRKDFVLLLASVGVPAVQWLMAFPAVVAALVLRPKKASAPR